MHVASLVRTLAARAGRPVPLSVTFEVTHLCNLACSYCDRHTPMPNEMSKEQILKALAQFIEMGTHRVKFDRGEPLAHRHIDKKIPPLLPLRRSGQA